jgi:hypothetical protein
MIELFIVHVILHIDISKGMSIRRYSEIEREREK